MEILNPDMTAPAVPHYSQIQAVAIRCLRCGGFIVGAFAKDAIAAWMEHACGRWD